MMRDYLIAMLAMPVLLLAWLLVQRFVREFSLRHPEFGPPREEGGGCGSSCGCKGKTACKNRDNHH
ncbi:MAG: chemotaxis protein [Thiothrix sp.]